MGETSNEAASRSSEAAGERPQRPAPAPAPEATGSRSDGAGAAGRADSAGASGGPVDAGVAGAPDIAGAAGASVGTDFAGVSSGSAAECQPIVVNVQQPKRSNAPIIVLCVFVGIAVLCFGGCALAGSSLLGGIGSLFATDAGAGADIAEEDLAALSGLSPEPSVAILQMSGEIGSDAAITPAAMRSAFDQIEQDDNIKAVLVVCNSPGGEAAPSWDIAQTVASCSKPVVFLADSLCASGAYMAAAHADWIVASPMSEVGSIGVYSQTVNASGLFDMLGIEMETIKSADMKDVGNMARPLTDEERAYLQGQVDELNQIFIDEVAEGRGKPAEEVSAWATGQTFLGGTALEEGMIDQVGTYQDALDKAAELAGLEPGCPTVEVSADGGSSLLDDLLGL